MRSHGGNMNSKKLKFSYRMIGATLIGVLFLVPASPSFAGWSLNIGYHNPPQAGIGVNFLYSWTQFALELGLGNIGTDANIEDGKQSQDASGVSLGLGGDINGKIFFLQAPLRPYLQLGTLLGTYGSLGNRSGLGFGSGGLFFGGGLWIGQASSIHGYFSYNLIDSSTFVQAGLGFDI